MGKDSSAATVERDCDGKERGVERGGMRSDMDVEESKVVMTVNMDACRRFCRK